MPPTCLMCTFPPRTPPPPGGIFFSPYKDVTINMDWNTNVISTMVTGARQPITAAMPPANTAVTLAFATGTCGSETWAGVSPAELAAANLQARAQTRRTWHTARGLFMRLASKPGTHGGGLSL